MTAKTPEQLVSVYGDMVYRLAYAQTRSRHDADDIFQEVFLQTVRKRPVFDSVEHEKAWLLRVAINRAKDVSGAFWRRNRVSWESYMDELEFVQPEDRSLFEAVMRLPEKYRIVIHLFYYEDYSVEEISAVLHRRGGTVKSQLSRGRKLLKSMLTEDEKHD